MTIKFYTIQNPPPVLAEPKSELPDECRQSDFVSLPTLLERFIASGAKYMEYMGAQSLSAEEKEALFESVDIDDLDDDIAVQRAFADSIVDKLVKEQDKREQEKKENKPTQSESKQIEPEKPETAENA